MSKILVLGGCGAMGTESTRDLARTSDFSEIRVADIDRDKASKLCQELGGGKLSALSVDVSDENALVKLFEDVDIVLNCTSYRFGLEITRAAIAAKKPMLDLGGLYNTPKQLAMSDQARAAGATIVLGMGATPGVTNLMGKQGVSRMESVDSIHVHFATYRRIAPSPGLVDTVLDEFSPSTVRFFFEEGKFVEVPPFYGEKQVEFNAPVGKTSTWIVPHSEVHAFPRSFPGVKRVDVRGTWRPETMAILKHYNEVGLLGIEPVTVDGVAVKPKALLRQLHLDHDDPNDPLEYAFLVNVEVVGSRNGARVVATYNLSHPPRSEWDMTCTAKVTGIPASIGAQLLARGVSQPGVNTPEAVFEPEQMFRELAKRKILVDERVVETRLYE